MVGLPIAGPTVVLLVPGVVVIRPKRPLCQYCEHTKCRYMVSTRDRSGGAYPGGEPGFTESDAIEEAIEEAKGSGESLKLSESV